MNILPTLEILKAKINECLETLLAAVGTEYALNNETNESSQRTLDFPREMTIVFCNDFPKETLF